jgi:uncharacterized protein
MIARRLGPGDRALVEAFLRAHGDSSLFLRSNLRAAGFVDRGAPQQATYVGAFVGGALRALAAHCWNGNLLLQAPEHLDAVVREAVARSGREVTGLIGPWDQACAARRRIADGRPTRLVSRDGLYALDVATLVRPPALDAPGVRCRAARAEDLDLAATWRVAYEVELLGAPDDAAHATRVRSDVARQHAERSLWLLEREGTPVATSAFNARLPDVVQIGGVYTPPADRRSGLARAVVAGSLLAVAPAGVGRAILFTGEDNLAARRAYEAIGFRRIGDYGLILFQDQAATT